MIYILLFISKLISKQVLFFNNMSAYRTRPYSINSVVVKLYTNEHIICIYALLNAQPCMHGISNCRYICKKKSVVDNFVIGFNYSYTMINYCCNRQRYIWDVFNDNSVFKSVIMAAITITHYYTAVGLIF